MFLSISKEQRADTYSNTDTLQNILKKPETKYGIFCEILEKKILMCGKS